MTPAEIAALTVSETLTAAADKLDALLAEVTPGPWTTEGVYRPLAGCRCLSCVEDEPYGMTLREVDSLGEDPSAVLKAADARWIAAMNPVPGRALVALLRDLAAVTWDLPDAVNLYRHELDLARAILGGES